MRTARGSIGQRRELRVWTTSDAARRARRRALQGPSGRGAPPRSRRARPGQVGSVICRCGGCRISPSVIKRAQPIRARVTTSRRLPVPVAPDRRIAPTPRDAGRPERWSAPPCLTAPASRCACGSRGPATRGSSRTPPVGTGPRGGRRPSRTGTGTARGAEQAEGGDVGSADPRREPQPSLYLLGRAEVLRPDQ